MPKPPTSASPTAAKLTVRERLLLFCIASGTDWRRAGIPDEVVTNMVEQGFVARDALGQAIAYASRARCAAELAVGAVTASLVRLATDQVPLRPSESGPAHQVLPLQ